jgi:hypothetical protein
MGSADTLYFTPPKSLTGMAFENVSGAFSLKPLLSGL